jgi:DNA-binding response OmpR family regulator
LELEQLKNGLMKILVADDDKMVLKALEQGLSSHGFKVVTASDGKQAADLINDHEFDLLVIDIMMPRVTGVQLFNFLKEFSSVPVIFISSLTRAQAAIVLESLGQPDFHYLEKPVKTEELSSMILKLAAKREGTLK